MRQLIIDTARTWIGTPYAHQGRVKDIGVDCIGLVIGVGLELGLLDLSKSELLKLARYNKKPNPRMMGELLNQYLEPVPLGEEKISDIPWMAWRGRLGMHAGIATKIDTLTTVIHCDSLVGSVVERKLPLRGAPSILSYFKYRGVE